MSRASAVWTIAGKDLRLRVRDRSAWLTAVIAPLALAAIISMALSGVGHHPHVRVGIVDQDHGQLAAAFLETVGAPPLRTLMTVDPLTSVQLAQTKVRNGTVNAAIIIPAGFSNQAAAVAPRLEVTSRSDQLLGEGIARSVADAFMSRVGAGRLAVLTTATLSPQAFNQDVATSVARQAAIAEAADPLIDRTPGRAVPPATYYGPAMAILFLFFLASFGARSFLVERRDNTLSRLLASPIPPWTVMAGKALATFVLGMLSLVVLYGASSVMFHADWGNPVAVLALSASVTAAVMAVTAFITSLAKTDDQANGYTGLVTFVCGLIGGNFIATYQLPPVLRAAASLTPNGWALRGFTDLAGGVASWPAVALPLAAMGMFTAVFGLLAVGRASRLVAP